MTTPVVFLYPVKRPGFITGVTWNGQPTDAQISLSIEYIDAQGLASQSVLYTTPNSIATLCLPSSKGIVDVDDDTLIAHQRMAGMISGTIPGSSEYDDAITGSSVLNARNFQTPIGDAKITDVTPLDERNIQVTWQKSSGGATKVVIADIQDLAKYAFAPSTQLRVIAGAIKKQYPTYIHDAATNKHLTQTQMDTIAAYVMGLDVWL
jgi:hypothetical protein